MRDDDHDRQDTGLPSGGEAQKSGETLEVMALSRRRTTQRREPCDASLAQGTRAVYTDFMSIEP